MEANTNAVSLDPKHRGEDVVNYHFGDLAPEARAEFEKHLETCVGCQKAVETASILFPAVNEALKMPKRRKTTDELVSMMMREKDRLESADRRVRTLRRKRVLRRTALWAGPIAAAAAAAALAAGPLVELVAKLTHPGKTHLAAPPKPKPEP